jgi:hypothetical protein
MSSTSILPSSFGADVSRAAQPGSWRMRVGRVALAIWRALEDYGRARAQHELRALHDRWSVSDPTLARQLREAGAFLEGRGAPHR